MRIDTYRVHRLVKLWLHAAELGPKRIGQQLERTHARGGRKSLIDDDDDDDEQRPPFAVLGGNPRQLSFNSYIL